MKRTYLVLIVTLLVIGFAVVATNLVINGTINFGFNKEDFIEGVVFSHINSSATVDATISEDEKTIRFESVKLEDINQKTYLRYDIANKSNQYDASVTVTCDFDEGFDTYSEWLDIENDLESTFTLQAGKTQTGNLTVTLKKAYDKGLNDNVNIKCTIDASPVSRDEKQEYKPVEHEYEEILLNGADPVLETTTTGNKKLIPVLIDEQGKVTRADTTKEWYSYEDKKWANAVILNNGVAEPSVGSEIKEDQIESYFVWIPKYRYKLWNVDGETKTEPFAIEIEFGTEDTKDDNNGECTTPLNSARTQALSGEKKNCDNNEWMTHPAFITMGVNGFWVGKFEVGYKGANSETEAQGDSYAPTKVIVKPNEYSWRGMTNKSMFNSLKDYASNLDSHMMKNTEWGAVAYLSHSKYGINKEVAQNTNSEYKTGYNASVAEYNSEEGVKASTTGNITGIYDMSGGSWEKMAAYRNFTNDINQLLPSGFTKEDIANIDEKYFDVYDKDTLNTSYEKRILGDATGEMGPFTNHISNWYQDSAYFVESTDSWFHRGGHHSYNSSNAGQFYFSRYNGSANINVGSRLVLSPK